MFRMLQTFFALLLLLALAPPQVRARSPHTPDFRVERHQTDYQVAADGTYRVVMERQYRVLTAQGVSRVGSLLVGHQDGRDTVESIDAWTLLPDGTRVPVDPERIRDRAEDNSEGASSFSDQRFRAIVYPQVEVGGAVGYRATIRRSEAAYPGEFEDSVIAYPTVAYDQVEVRYAVPVQRTLHIDQRGFEGGLERSQDGVNHYRFRYRRAETSAPQSHAASPLHYADQLHVSTMPDMVALGRLSDAGFAANARVDAEISGLAARLTAGLVTERDKAAALHAWVARNIRYVAVHLGSGRLVPHPAAEVLRNRYGDCKDHVVLLQALLAAAGIASSPALVGTEPAYAFTKVGTHFPLDHVITYLPSLDLYVDATSRFAPFGTLPDAVAGKPVVLTALGRVARTPMNTAAVNTVRTDVTLRIRPDGTIEGESITRKTGDEEVGSRSARFAAANEDEESLATGVLARFNETGSGRLRFPDPLDLQTPFTVLARFELDAPATLPGRGAIRVPVGMASGDLETIAATRPPSALLRPYPCASRTVEERYRIEFPDNVQVEAPPADAHHADGEVTYTSRYVLDGSTVNVERRLVVDRRGPLCTPEDMARWSRVHRVVQRDLRGLVFYR